jgi:hypothetical protein
MLFIQNNIDKLIIHVTVKISTFANLQVQSERFIWEPIPEDEQQMLQDTLSDNDSHLTMPISGISA